MFYTWQIDVSSINKSYIYKVISTKFRRYIVQSNFSQMAFFFFLACFIFAKL